MESIINSIKSKARSGIHPGLENIALLCKELGNIQDSLKFIHVAGTNGKGSACAFCESILSNAGIKTGCYTSPCVFEKTEQFKINGQNCSTDVFIKAAHIVLDAVDRINIQGYYPSEFEIETAIAFEIFYLEKCDICIVECGMGGLLDATNIIKNTIVSILTPIAKDHTAFLGDSLTEIAENKCGIIKNDSAVVCANQHNEAEYIIKEKCSALNITPLFIDNSHITDIVLNDMVMDFTYKNIRYSTQLIGIHQTHNAALAAEACLALKQYGYNLTDDDIKNGILNAKNPGRFEILSANPLVICDGAHNIHGAEALKNTIKEFFGDKKFNVVMGVFKDKDYNGILAILSEISDCIITVEPKGERALDKKKLCDAAKKYFESAQISDIDSVVDKIRKSNKAYCICGSLSYLNDFKNSFYKQKHKENKMDKDKIEAGVKLILEGIGEDCSREGLVETPQRVARMYEEIFAGYNDNAKNHLSKTFTAENNEMVIEKDITFYSCCEHHILPFFGKAHIAYIPDGKVVGISKLARCVDVYAKRLQIQEQMTAQIAQAIMNELSPKGVIVAVEAEHTCMTMRGVKKVGSKTFTYCCKGEFETNSELRSQFFSIIK